MSDAREMRRLMQITEGQLIKVPDVMAVRVSNYELARLMMLFRGEADAYNQAGDSALVSFYSQQEQEEFKKYLRSKGVAFDELENEKGGNEEQNDDSASKPLLPQYKGPAHKNMKGKP